MLRSTPETTGPGEHALTLHRAGLRLVPLRGKRPLMRDWPELQLSESQILDWNRRGVNWGVITGDPLIVIDTDSTDAEKWVNARGIDSPVTVRTGGGGLHRYFLQPEHQEIHSTHGLHGIQGLDVKGWRSFVVAAGSLHPGTGRRYAYLPGKELAELHQLPEFQPEWIRPIRPEPLPKPQGAAPRVSGAIRDVRRYIRGIPSVEGHGGDKACFTVACLLVEAGYRFDDALAELEEWNLECAIPIWSRTQLIHKLRYAFKRVLGSQPPQSRKEDSR